MLRAMGDFHIDGMAMRYHQFVPRLYNYCLSLGLRRGRMIPSRAFCSDENQGYPVILITQHFGTFPFNHGQVGGVVALDRHGPHADHGDDLVIIQASHVGFDPDSQQFGIYRRALTAGGEFGDCCGKVCGVLDWYRSEYLHAADTILLDRVDGTPALFIDNHLLDPARSQGLFLRLDRMIEPGSGEPLRVRSTAKAFPASRHLQRHVPPALWDGEPRPIGPLLRQDMFFFQRPPTGGAEGHDQLEANLAAVMPGLCTSPRPTLDAARYNTQVEFDRTYRSILRSRAYAGRNLVFIAGLNIDISPPDGMLFPLTKFVPWAASCHAADGRSLLLEQDALVAALRAQSSDNPQQISFDAAIARMSAAPQIALPAVG